MSVLIDTSVWVDHFRRRNEGLLTPDARLWTLDKRLAELALLFDGAFAIEP